MKALRAPLLILAILTTVTVPVRARPAGPSARPDVVDIAHVIDVNRIRMFVTNQGLFAYDLTTGNAGLEFPKGSGKFAVFSAGLWLGGMSGGQLRVAVADYGTEYGPGAMIGTSPDDPTRPEYKVYVLDRVYADPAARDAALADYTQGAVPHGAPPVVVLGDGSLNIKGDQMLWAVFNDADPANHTHIAGGTLPLGVEVQQTVYALGRPGPAGQAVILEYRLTNKSANPITEAYVSLWADPDLGGAADDLVGCDVPRGMGFCYNATNNDLVYGSMPPAVGFDLIQGPVDVASGDTLGMVSFNKYVGGTDPSSAQQVYNYMKGLNPDGSPLIDPTTSQPTTYAVSGDPVAGTGWLDSNPADRRLMLSSGPFSMAPGAVQTIVAAVIIGDGTDRLSSITKLRLFDDAVQAAYPCGFPRPLAPRIECPGDLAWQAGTAQNLDYSLANDTCAPVTYDYTLYSERDWPGFPINGSVAVEGRTSAIVTIPVPVPDTALGGSNLLELHAHVDLADELAAICQHHLQDPSTPVLLSLVSAEAEPGRVRLTWYVQDAESPTATIFRREEGTAWSALGEVEVGPTGMIVFEDREVTPGSRHAYRVGILSGGHEVTAGEVWVDVPAVLQLSLGRVSPNPTNGEMVVAFTLPSADPARLDVLDVAGRRLASRRVEALGAGSHQIRFEESARWPAGAYVLRLTQGGRSLTTKAFVIR